MGIVWGTLKASVARRCHKVLSRTEDEADVIDYCRMAMDRIEALEGYAPWWAERPATLTITALDYDLTLPSDFLKLKGNSIEYGRGRKLHPLAIEFINARVPNWRDSTVGGSPKYFVVMGSATSTDEGELWICPKPSSGFATNYSEIEYQYIRTDRHHSLGDDTDDAEELYIPKQYSPIVIHAALAEGLQQEDDPDWERFDRMFEGRDKFKIIGADVMGEIDEEIAGPEYDSYYSRYPR